MSIYDESHRQLQKEFASEALAERLEEVIVRPTLDERATTFIQSRDFFMLTTIGADGFPTVSYKGGAVGFVQVVDECTLRFPFFDGNGMWLSAGNIAGRDKVGMLFIDFEEPQRVRLQGTARILRGAALAAWPEAALAVEVAVTCTWVNCPRYVHQMQRVANSEFVPKAGIETPEPPWKAMPGLADVVPPSAHKVKP